MTRLDYTSLIFMGDGAAMSAPTSKPLAQQAAAKLREMREKSDREMREAINETQRENNPRTQTRFEFSPFIARIQRRTTPTTTDEIVRALVDELERRGHITNYGGNLKFRSGSSPTATPIRTPEQMQRAVLGSTGKLMTIDLCAEVLKFFNHKEN